MSDTSLYLYVGGREKNPKSFHITNNIYNYSSILIKKLKKHLIPYIPFDKSKFKLL
jgi:hypothetical protein